MSEVPESTQHEPVTAEEVLRESASSLTMELRRISEEILSINSGFQVQLKRALDDARIAIREEVQKELSVELEKRSEKSRAIQTEIQRVMIALEAIAEEIAQMIDDPGVELSR